MKNIEKHLEEKLGDVLFKDFASLKDFKSIKNTPIGKSLLDMQKAIGLQSNPIKIGKNQLSTAEDIFNAIKNGSLQGKELGRVGKGLLKSPSTPSSVRISLINDFIVDSTVVKELNGKNVSEIKKLLKSKGYADESINEIIKQSKGRGFIENNIFVGKSKPGTIAPGSATPGVTSTKTSKIVDLLKKVPTNIKDGIMNLLRAKKPWRVIVKWGLLAGVSLTTLWWFIKDSGIIPDGFPDNVPSEFPPCVQDLIKNKQGEVLTETNGGVVIVVKNNEYPNGIQFYPNGRVLDVKTGKRGTYKCKGEKVTLEEQSSEIDVDTLSSYVSTAIDDLDGFVTTSNLTSLENTLKALKGKTFQGKSALSEFLFLYKENEGSDFVSDVNSVGVRTLDPKASLIKRNVLGMLSGSPTTTKTSSGNLSGIDITWDTKTSTGGGGSTGSGTGNVQYKDKSDFPFPRGTRNEKIRDVQKSLGFPQKYQTGNFGPMTYKGLVSFIQNPESYKYGLTGGWSAYIEELKTIGLTKDLYDIIMRFGKKIEVSVGGQTTSGETQTQGQTMGGETSPVDTQTTGSDVTTNTTSPDRTPATTDETPSQLFNRFVKEGTIKGRLNGARIVYKGGDLTDGDREKLISQLNSMGFRVSRENLDYRKGDKIVFKKNETEE